MPIKIASLDEALRIHSEFDYVISITDPKTYFPDLGEKHLHVCFEDVGKGSSAWKTRSLERGTKTIFTWAKNKGLTKEHKILVHCYAGISRSSAIAWSLMTMFGEDMVASIELFYSDRPFIWPNVKVIQVMDKLLQCNGVFLELAKKLEAELIATNQHTMGSLNV